MPRFDRTQEEKDYSEDAIKEDFLAGRVTILRNEPLIYVWSEKIFGTDFPWFESRQKDTEGKIHGDRFSVLAPMSSRVYFLSIQKDPMTPFAQKGKFDIHIEEVQKDLHLTHVEAKLFRNEELTGQTQVMKGIRHKIKDKDPVTGLENVLRYGILGVIAPATGEAAEPTLDNIADFIMDTDMYRGHKMSEMSNDYLTRMVMQTGAGANSRAVGLCKLEFKRRQNATAPEAKPTVTCAGTTVKGEPCKAIGTVECDGKMYCKSHIPCEPGGES